MSKYKILANPHQLASLGISYSITGLIGELVNKYPDGYLCLSVTHEYKNNTFTNQFDIPSYLCEEIINNKLTN